MAPIQKIGAPILPGQGDLATIQEACPASSNMVRGRPICYNVALAGCWSVAPGEKIGGERTKKLLRLWQRATLLTRSRHDQPFIESILVKRGVLESPTTRATLLTTAR